MWNIAGLNKYRNGNPVINYLNTFDIIGLIETRGNFSGEFDTLLPGFIHFDCVRKNVLTRLETVAVRSVFV